MRLAIEPAELRARQSRLLGDLDRQGLSGMVLFNPTSIFYLTGFAFYPTERPIALVRTAERSVLFLPRLEREHGQEVAEVDEVHDYPEYPGEVHPMRRLGELLAELGYGKGGRTSLAADADGYGSNQGYKGPRLSDVLQGVEVRLQPKLVEDHRVIKSPREIELIRESARWGNLAHRLLQEYALPGASETEISFRASHEATMAMVRTLGPAFEPRGLGRAGASAGFRGQVGPNSALPHAITKNIVLKAGDVLVTGAGATVWGYNSELERTMFVGRPSPEQERWFHLMVAMQDVCFETIKPGRPCADVDRAMRAFVDRHDLWDHWRHHVGHAIGILGHEAPFFDLGDDTEIRPGMVFTVEPGLYVPGLGGFRHSDTVLVTETGIEMITYYPRQLEDMVCGA